VSYPLEYSIELMIVFACFNLDDYRFRLDRNGGLGDLVMDMHANE
jgi:hypothetical protein